MLAEKINNDLKEAMKNKDSFKLGVIRMIKGAMQLAKPNPREELTDDDVIQVISKQIKMRKDAIEQFEAAGREDLEEVTAKCDANKTEMRKVEDDDTLENDLFDLIDSMYDNREEGDI